MKLKRICALTAALILAFGTSLSVAADTTWTKKTTDEGCTSKDGEILFGNIFLGEGETFFDEARKSAEPNTLQRKMNTPAGAVTKIVIESDRVGVAVEPSATENFEVDIAGAKDASLIKLTTSVNGNTLLVKAQGDKAVKYINTDPDFRVNTVVLRLPAKRYLSLNVQANNGSVLLYDPGCAVTLNTGNATAILADSTIESPLSMQTGNGGIELRGDSITSKAILKAKNGGVKVHGKTINGDLRVETENGSAEVYAETLGLASIKTQNGRVVVDAGTVKGNVFASTENGEARLNLHRQPTDLDFIFAGGNWTEMTLPSGWERGIRFGSGEPKLTLRCGNGSVKVTVGKSLAK